MTKVTYADLDRFGKLCGEIQVKSEELAVLTAKMAQALPGVGPADMTDAARLGMATAVGATETWRQLLERFEREALQCLGERRRQGEDLDAFYGRVCGADLRDMMRRNGVTLDARRPKAAS